MLTRRAFLLAILACPLFGAASAKEDAVLTPWSGTPDAPPIDLLRPDGSPVNLKDLRGKVVLVNFWATWCEPCVAEMPSLQRLRSEFGAERLEVLGVNFQEGPARINAFVQRAGITFPIVRDTDGAVARSWSARVFPSTFVVDRGGRIRFALMGEADWTSPAIVNAIRPLLERPPR